jgi:WD40 repeat protein
VKSGEELWSNSNGNPDRSYWSPDGRTFLLVGETDTAITVWNYDTLSCRFSRVLDELIGTLMVMLPSYPWSPCSSKFVLASNQGEVFIFDAFTGDLIHTLSNHEGKVASPRWSPDGKWIITTGIEDGKVTIWDSESGFKFNEFMAGFDDGRVVCNGWSPGGDQFAIRGLGGGKIINFITGEEILSLKVPKVYWGYFYWSMDGSMLLSTGREDGTVRLWDAASGKQIAQIDGLVQSFSSDWSPSGEYVAIAGSDGNVRVVNITTKNKSNLLESPADMLCVQNSHQMVNKYLY